ncbi:MAG TPA: hypothetical protein VNB49_18850 [Candidatus Dormibacteraeota bacterium]|nr:hypothetical protein [Candidatus Dormibacteraeota bacterium]
MMKRTAARSALGTLFFFYGVGGVVLAVSTPIAFGQACSSKPLLQGRVCTKPGARCSPVTAGGGDSGKCTIEGSRPDALTCECQGAPTPSYNITLSGLTPSYIDKDAATSTITVIPFNGFTGKVDFTCTVSGAIRPAPSCANPVSATVTSGGSATSQLTVSASSSTAEGPFTVTVGAVDEHGQPPDNGAQSSTVAVSHVRWMLMGGGRMAFLTFVALLALWSVWRLWRSKRAGLR